MAITDATGYKNTTYTENDVVAFTSGTLATIDACVSEVESKVQRGTFTTTSTPTLAQVQTWLIRAKQELAEVKSFEFKRRFVYTTLTTGTYVYSMPPDYNGGSVSLKDTSNDRQIKVWPRHVYDFKYPDPSYFSNDAPLVATIKNMELWFAPPPDSTIALEIEYERSGDDNTPTDFSWLPQMERFRCCDFAISEAFEALHLFEVAGFFRNKWAEGMGKAKRIDGKRKWNKYNYQATSFLQTWNR